MDDMLLFFSTFVKYPKEIGSVMPSSRFLVNKMLKSIDFTSAKYIAEYGPGTGCITIEILKRARPDAKILCFETNKKFCDYLKKNIKDERLIIINDGAENIKKYVKKLGISQVDCIVSSLPFFTLSDKKKSIIIEETKSTLKNHGKFVMYKYLSNFRKKLYNYFSDISTKFVPLNIPPSFVYICEK